jgi:hypothetical protein
MRRERATLLLVVGFGLFWLAGIAWGVPDGFAPNRVTPWGHDDNTPLGPLIEMHGLFVQRPEHRFLAYPLMQHMLLAVCYAPYLAWLWLSGQFVHPTSVYPYGFAQPWHAIPTLTAIARCVAVAMGVGTLLAARDVGRTLWSARAGFWCALFAALSYPMFYYTRTGNLDGPYMFWASLGLCAYARILRGGWSVPRGLALGAFAALAAGTKDQAANIFVLLPLALLPRHARTRPFAWRPLLATLGAGAGVYVVASALVFDPLRWWQHVQYVLGIGELGTYLPNHPNTAAGYADLARETLGYLDDGIGIPLWALALASLGRDLARDRGRAAFALAALSTLLSFVLPTRYVLVRYLEPAFFVAACFAGGLVVEWLARSGIVSCALAAAATALAIAVPGWRGIELTHAMLRDSRVSTAAWLRDHACAGDRVGFFGPNQTLPRIGPDLSLVSVGKNVGTRWDLEHSAADIAAMEAELARVSPEWALVIPDHTVAPPALPHGSALPPPFYAAVMGGQLGYARVAHLQTPKLWIERPYLLKGFRVTNPPVDVLARADVAARPRGDCTPPR